jgi:hypothetical protein
MTDPSKRIARWNAKYDTTRIKATLDELRPAMLAAVTAVFPLLTAMELQVKQTCDHPVPVLPELRPGDLGAYPQGSVR